MPEGAQQLQRKRKSPLTAHDFAVKILGVAAEADAAWFRDELAYTWRTAQDEASVAYQAWQESPGAIGYAVYRAAQDRADKAQDVLAERAVVP